MVTYSFTSFQDSTILQCLIPKPTIHNHQPVMLNSISMVEELCYCNDDCQLKMRLETQVRCEFDSVQTLHKKVRCSVSNVLTCEGV